MKWKEQKTVPIENIGEWDDNPRYITEHDRERLKSQLKKHGMFKPLVCYEEGNVYVALGGNMRLAAARELVDEGHEEFKQVWISVVEVRSDKEKLEIALADNDRAGHYNEDELVPLLKQHDDFSMEDYHIDTAFTVGLDTMMDRYGFMKEREQEEIDESHYSGQNKEIDLSEIEKKLDLQCPSCGFMFNKKQDEKTG